MLKWLLSWKKEKKGADSQNNCALTELYQGDRGIGQLHENDAELRLWLPEPLRMALDQTGNETNTRESRYLREFLIVYLYGVHELLKMRAFKTGLYYEPPPKPNDNDDDNVFYSRVSMSEVIPGLGKNLVACKLRLPAKIKADLQDLAEQNGLPLGRFVREILVQHFLGHTIWPERFPHMPEQQSIADAWVEGKVESFEIRSEAVDKSIDTPVKSYYW